MRFLDRAGKSRESSVAHTVPPVHVTGAGMGKQLQPQRSGTTQPALCLQSTYIPSSGLRSVFRGGISPASC